MSIRESIGYLYAGSSATHDLKNPFGVLEYVPPDRGEDYAGYLCLCWCPYWCLYFCICVFLEVWCIKLQGQVCSVLLERLICLWICLSSPLFVSVHIHSHLCVCSCGYKTRTSYTAPGDPFQPFSPLLTTCCATFIEGVRDMSLPLTVRLQILCHSEGIYRSYTICIWSGSFLGFLLTAEAWMLF